MINKNRLEYIIFLFLGNLLCIFGFRSIKYSSKLLAYFFFYVIRIRRNTVIKNLQIAFPKLNSEQINQLAFKNYQSAAITFLEIFNLRKLDRNEIKQMVTIINSEIFYQRYAEKRGMILLTAHFGNWELAAVATGIHINERIHVLVKKQRNSFVAKWLTYMRERFGNVQIFLGVSVRELFKAIKDNKIVGIVGDQRGKRDGVRVKYFGKETLTFPGTAAIAIKTNCPVIVFLPSRQPDGTYLGTVREIDHSKYEGTIEDKIRAFNQEYMKILEEAIKENPEQWFWMHNIWKY